MKVIQLTKGKVTLVDDADYDFLMQWPWLYMGGGYAGRSIRKPEDGHRGTTLMHRVILGVPQGIEIDHINTDKLDNRRSNLRECDRSNNNCNVGIRKDNTSGYKGADLSFGKWRARIRLHGVQYHLGTFSTPEEAHAAYCEASKRLHGEFGRTG